MKNYLGIKKNSLTVIEQIVDKSQPYYKKNKLVCKCDCGNITTISNPSFGRQKSCGKSCPTICLNKSINFRFNILNRQK